MYNSMYRKTAERLMQALSECTCSFTTVRYAAHRLGAAGYRELRLENIADWRVAAGDRICINVYGSSLFAFSIGKKLKKGEMLRLGAAHTDSPALYIKPRPEMKSGKYGKVNVEIYGGAILNTWLDRPLSVAGRVSLRGKNVFEPQTVVTDFKKKVFTIPNLAIHLNREVNKGIELNRQNDMSPVCTVLTDELNRDDFFMNWMAAELGVKKDDILDYELYIYISEEGCLTGMEEEMISAPRLDNITSVEALVNAFTGEDGMRESGINGIVLYDNEEVGSRSKQGADSELLAMVTERIYSCLGYGREEYLSAVINGFMLSADVAHAFHPNHGEKADATNINTLNDGFVIKRACSQTYGTDCRSIAAVEQLCMENDIPYQKFASRSDVSTGSTLGNIANKYLPMRTVDIGVPILAMHSARELMGIRDQWYIENVIKEYFGRE